MVFITFIREYNSSSDTTCGYSLNATLFSLWYPHRPPSPWFSTLFFYQWVEETELGHSQVWYFERLCSNFASKPSTFKSWSVYCRIGLHTIYLDNFPCLRISNKIWGDKVNFSVIISSHIYSLTIIRVRLVVPQRWSLNPCYLNISLGEWLDTRDVPQSKITRMWMSLNVYKWFYSDSFKSKKYCFRALFKKSIPETCLLDTLYAPNSQTRSSPFDGDAFLR